MIIIIIELPLVVNWGIQAAKITLLIYYDILFINVSRKDTAGTEHSGTTAPHCVTSNGKNQTVCEKWKIQFFSLNKYFVIDTLQRTDAVLPFALD